MFSSYLKKAQQLSDEGKPFVVALVVNFTAPISGKTGDRAIITEDGELWGWVAGGCSQSIIIEEALAILKTGEPRLIHITPDTEGSNHGIMKRKMTCHSGGTLEVYLEPVVPAPQIVIMGSSAVALALCKLSSTLDYRVVTLGPNSDISEADMHIDYTDLEALKITRNTFVVVSTQGEGDEQALETAVSLGARYLALVASKKKAQALREYLSAKKVASQLIAAIKSPAGLDIKARRPEEIALSILAEIVMKLREPKEEEASTASVSQQAIDPICGMKVNISTARHSYLFQGDTFYFCGEGCKSVFEAEPEKYSAIERP